MTKLESIIKFQSLNQYFINLIHQMYNGSYITNMKLNVFNQTHRATSERDSGKNRSNPKSSISSRNRDSQYALKNKSPAINKTSSQYALKQKTQVNNSRKAAVETQTNLRNIRNKIIDPKLKRLKKQGSSLTNFNVSSRTLTQKNKICPQTDKSINTIDSGKQQIMAEKNKSIKRKSNLKKNCSQSTFYQSTQLHYSVATMTNDSVGVGEQQVSPFQLQKPSIPLDDYASLHHFEVVRQVGQGEYSNDCIAIERVSGLAVRLKVYNKEQIIQQGNLEQFVQSLKIHKILNSPTILKLYGVFCTSHFIYVVCECNGTPTTINQQLQAKSTFSEDQINRYVTSIVNAVKYMHNNDVMHRSLKLSNLEQCWSVIKIVEFTWATSITNYKNRQSFCGDICFTPPELAKGLSYDTSIDVWIIGVLIYEMALGFKPFISLNSLKQRNLHLPVAMSDQLGNMLCKILGEKQQRPTLSELSGYPWMRKLRAEELVSQEIWSFWCK